MKSIKYVVGQNLFDLLPSKGNVCIAHVCNDVGAWGAGFVVPLAKRFPLAEQAYHDAYQRRELILGDTEFIETPDSIVVVANMVAQHEFPNPSKGYPCAVDYEKLRDCLESVAKYFRHKKVELHCPKFGTGIAGGDWKEIEPMIQSIWCARNFGVTIYSL